MGDRGGWWRRREEGREERGSKGRRDRGKKENRLAHEKDGVLPAMKTASFLFLLNPNVLQAQRTRDEADLTALFHQPAYPPIIVIFLESREESCTQ